MGVTRREIIAGAAAGLIGARVATAQQPPAAEVPVRKGKIVKLFKTQEGFPNALAASPEGWWVGEQKTQHACLLDWNGKVLKTIPTESKNTSGIAYGGGSVWMCANAAPNGIHQINLKSGASTPRQIPLGGGGCHGAEYADGKLWIAALRLRGILRVDAKTWEPEYLIPYNVPRAHGLALDNGFVWLVTATADGKAGLNKYEAATSKLVESVKFDELYPDPHGLAFHEGAMYTCDAGIHPGWQESISPATGYICRIEIS
jgi:streptogramin lyase